MKSLRCLLIIFIGVFLTVARSSSDEGMWLLDGVGKLPLKELKSDGLILTPDKIYSAIKPSLKDAIVLIGGGTGSFVSSEGLVMTNHHVAFRAIQYLSTTEHDYIRDGFWAKTREEELPAPTYTATLLKSMQDVTIEVLGVVTPTMTEIERTQAIEEKSREIERRVKGISNDVCQVVEMYSGVKYYLFISERYTDIRLVYAPPSSIGNFGGEIDNWMWPRHTGDFSIFRVYADRDGRPARYSRNNVPYKPVRYLPISTKGYHDGSFVMIMGYPGKTYRYNDSFAVTLLKEETFPITVDLYKTRMDILQKWSDRDRATALKLANKIKDLANTYKNRLGAIEDFSKYNLIQRKRNEETEFQKWLSKNPELYERYGTVLQQLTTASAQLRAFNKKQVYLNNISAGVDLLQIAIRIDTVLAGRTQFGQSGSISLSINDRLRQLLPFIRQTFKDYDANADKEILTALFIKSHDLPAEQRISVTENILKQTNGTSDNAALGRYIDSLYSHTMLATLQSAEDFLEKDSTAIAADPLVRLASEFNVEDAQLRRFNIPLNAVISTLRTKLTEGWIFWKGGNIYPDANRTMRLTYGTVIGYDPRDGVSCKSTTHLTGAVEKATDSEPFDLPKKLIELEKQKDFGPYADQKSNDIITCFLSNLDITGGNSGSPVINGNGEFIGVAFDGNYEALTGDFEFDPKLNRTISVDARYILFILDKFSGATNILRELDIR
ncbi:MAG: S46 family peptidase [Bacteroidota bacterium]